MHADLKVAALPIEIALAIALLALFALVDRLGDRRSAVAAVLVFTTTPLCTQLFTASPAASATAGISLSTAGLGLAALGLRSKRARWTALAVGLAGMALTAAASESWALAGLPALSVALARALSGCIRAGRFAGWVAAGAAACALTLAISRIDPASPLLGWCGGDAAATQPPTFDRVIADLGHTLFPWSAFLPWALGHLSEPATRGSKGSENALGILILAGATLATAFGAAASHCSTGPVYPVMFFAAAAFGVWIGALWRGTHAPRTAWCGVGLIAVVLTLDFIRIPDKRWLAFMPGAAPSSLRQDAGDNALGASFLSAALACLLASLAAAWLLRVCRRDSKHGLVRLLPFMGALLGALLLRCGYHPRLVERFSPDRAIVLYRERALGGDELGLLGVPPEIALQAGVEPQILSDGAQGAVNWLDSAPVLDAKSELSLLAVDHLVSGERNHNPLERVLVTDMPSATRPLDRRLPVTRGAQDQHRVKAGTLELR